jgi:hypothetical protein
VSYSEIIILGWNINGLMFIVNLFIVINSSGSNDPTQMQRQSEKLKELKEEIEDIFPLRKYDIFITYFVPFTALFKVSYRVYEMNLFFKANEGTKLYDFMVYKLEKDISNRKNN